MDTTHDKTRLRLLSFVALLLLLCILWLAIVLVLTHPGVLILGPLGVAILAGGAWMMLTGTRGRQIGGVAMSLLGLAVLGASAWALLSYEGNVRRLILLALLVAAYGAAAGAVARTYWARKRSEARPGGMPARPALIINPKAGGGRAEKARIPDKARALGVDVTLLERGQSVTALAKAAADGGAQVLGVSGGDGTLGAVAAVAIARDLPLVVLPGGTRCHFARDIGLSPARITDALAGFNGVERRVDVAQVGDRILLNNISFGLYADIISRPEYRDSKVAVTEQTLRSLATSEKSFYPLRFKDAQGTRHEEAAQVLVGVNRYETVKLLELGERKRLDGGLLHVIVVPELSQNPMANLRKTEWTATSFKVSDPSGWVQAGIDGEAARLKSPVTVRIRPRALRLLVPAEGVRTRPIKPVSREAAQTLWGLMIK